jgi:stage II sporulation protein D
VRPAAHGLWAVVLVTGLTVAALVSWPHTVPVTPSLDVRSIPAPLRTARAVPTRTVRVCVTSGPVADVRLRVRRGAVWRDLGSAKTLSAPTDEETQAVTATRDGLRVGNRTYRTNRLEIAPATSPGVWVDGHLYRGSVRLVKSGDDRLLAVNVVPLEEYVAAVVDGEMPATFPDAARRAQAVVARTYAVAKQAAAGRAVEFDVYASERSQRYLGIEYTDRAGRHLAGESGSSRVAARDTAGQVLTFEGRVFTSYYSACCGGCTTTGSELFPDAAACHRAVPCEFCQDAERYRWQVKLPTNEFRQAVNSLDRGRLTSLRRVRMLTSPGKGELAGRSNSAAGICGWRVPRESCAAPTYP